MQRLPSIWPLGLLGFAAAVYAVFLCVMPTVPWRSASPMRIVGTVVIVLSLLVVAAYSVFLFAFEAFFVA